MQVQVQDIAFQVSGLREGGREGRTDGRTDGQLGLNESGSGEEVKCFIKWCTLKYCMSCRIWEENDPCGEAEL